jgi:hypothetical protein
LLVFQREAREEVRRSLDGLFESGHPNRVALLDPASLEQFLECEAQQLAVASPSAVLAVLWRRVASQLVMASNGPDRWAAVEREAESLAVGLGRADGPLGEVCRSHVAARYRPESLRALLLRLARPRRVGESGPPAIESHAASSLFRGSPEISFVLTFHWRPARWRRN